MNSRYLIHIPVRRAAVEMIVAALLCLSLFHHVSAQGSGETTKAGTTAAQFLKIDPTPRAAAFGGAFAAVASDVSALYWNPSGISRLTRNEGILSHTGWIADINYNFGGVVVPLGSIGTIGASVMTLGTEDMDVRTVDEPEGTGEKFGAGDLAAGLSYARNLTDRFSIGFTAKYIREYIWHMTASTFALDVGTLYRTDFHGLTIGMSITNFGGKMKYEGRDAITYINVNPGKAGTNDKVVADIRTDEWSLPLAFRVGLAAEPVAADAHHLIVAIDAIHANDNTECINFGAEYTFMDMISLRGGYRSLFRTDSEEGLTLGGGVRYDLAGTTLKADYSWAYFGRLKSVQRFSFAVEF